ncbi:MAG: hypothetical protein Ct9H300mP26_0610 [Acidimicrobiales bacterium]|nr:MAG: hypothetical protein Ct9H300mP26_0610 [Acidimicrobiales bacterium]
MSRVTTAGNAPSLDKYLLMAYLPTDLCALGTELQVMYQNEMYPVRSRQQVPKPRTVRPE